MIRKPPGKWKGKAGEMFWIKDTRYGVRYYCQSCGKEALGLGGREHNHRETCPHYAAHEPLLPRGPA